MTSIFLPLEGGGKERLNKVICVIMSLRRLLETQSEMKLTSVTSKSEITSKSYLKRKGHLQTETPIILMISLDLTVSYWSDFKQGGFLNFPLF